MKHANMSNVVFAKKNGISVVALEEIHASSMVLIIIERYALFTRKLTLGQFTTKTIRTNLMPIVKNVKDLGSCVQDPKI
jgi:hypothetical protein